MEDSVTISLEKYESIKQKNKDFDLFISDIFEIFWDLATQKEYHDMIQKKLSDRNIRVENESGGVCRYVGNGKKIFKTNV